MKSAFRLLTLANEQRRYLRTLYRQAVVGVDRLILSNFLPTSRLVTSPS